MITVDGCASERPAYATICYTILTSAVFRPMHQMTNCHPEARGWPRGELRSRRWDDAVRADAR